MSVIGTAQELPDSPTVNLELNERSYERHFRVQCNSSLDGPLVVCNAPGIPKLFSPYLFGNDGADQYALVRHIKADRIGTTAWYWKVTCEYSTPKAREHDKVSGGEQDQKASFDNPLLMLPEVETSTERFEEVVWFVWKPGIMAPDITGAAIAPYLTPCKASNGQVFDPPPTRDASRITLTITRNEGISTPHPAIDIKYTDALNADTFWGSPAGVWKCMGITSRRETKQMPNGTLFPYLKVTYKFASKKTTWKLQLLDAGAYYYATPGDETTKTMFKSQDQHPIIGPLDGNGGKLAPGANPVFSTFDVYTQIPFAPLVLPQSFTQCA